MSILQRFFQKNEAWLWQFVPKSKHQSGRVEVMRPSVWVPFGLVSGGFVLAQINASSFATQVMINLLLQNVDLKIDV